MTPSVALTSLLLLALTSVTTAHFAVTYPYWRGDSYATQWTYPCGGVNQSESDGNRTLWPLDGGAVAFTPTHPWAQTYINLGLGGNVTRLNITLVEPFNQTSNGTFCFPKVSLPQGIEVKEGDNASIQVIQISHSGGALYNCADIQFSTKAKDPGEGVCFNSTGVGAEPLDYDGDVESANASTGGDSKSASNSLVGYVPGTLVLVAAVVVAGFMV